MSKECLIRNNITVSGNDDAGRTIVFVHGLGTDQAVWKQVAEPFRNGCREILLDHVGATSHSRDYFLTHQSRYVNITAYADDLLELCHALRLEKPAIFVGHSLGAMACLLASVKKPEIFEKLVLIGTSPCYMNIGDYKGGLEKSDIDSIYGAIFENYSGWATRFASSAMENPDRPELTRRFEEALRGIPPKMMLTVLCSLLQGDHRAEIESVTTPTMLIQSQHDAFVPRFVADYLHSKIRNSRLHIIDTAGHLPHVTDPLAVVRAMESFIGI